jgi:5'(3')-deoxyribonucleotidase
MHLIDNVVAKSDDVMRAVIREITVGRVNLRHEDVLRFSYQTCPDANGQKITDAEWSMVHDRFSEPDCLISIQPYEGAASWLSRLSGLFSIHFATSRLPKAREATVRWLVQHGFVMDNNLHFLSHGRKHTSLANLAAAVEDDLDQARAFAIETKIDSFVMNRPWNQDPSPPPKLHRVRDWEELGSRLSDLAKSLNPT